MRLVYYSSKFVDKVESIINTTNPFIANWWAYKKEKELPLRITMGFPTGQVFLCDRAGKRTFAWKTSVLNTPWFPVKEYPRKDFKNCMVETAQTITKLGKTIDLFYSGGLDSTAALLAFIESGAEKQLHLIIGGYTESLEIFNKYIKGRIDYTQLENPNNLSFTSIAKPDEHILCSCSEADEMFGSKSSLKYIFVPFGTLEEQKIRWKNRRRYSIHVLSWRWAGNFQGDWVDVNNYQPFYTRRLIDEWLCNHVIDNNMVFHESFGERFSKNIKYKNLQQLAVAAASKGQYLTLAAEEHYKKVKMPLRDFIYDITGNKEYAYNIPKYGSGIRIKEKDSPRVLAFLLDGTVITDNNFEDYNWLTLLEK